MQLVLPLELSEQPIIPYPGQGLLLPFDQMKNFEQFLSDFLKSQLVLSPGKTYYILLGQTGFLVLVRAIPRSLLGAIIRTRTKT